MFFLRIIQAICLALIVVGAYYAIVYSRVFGLVPVQGDQRRLIACLSVTIVCSSVIAFRFMRKKAKAKGACLKRGLHPRNETVVKCSSGSENRRTEQHDKKPIQ